MQYNWYKIEWLCYAAARRERLKRKHPYWYYVWDVID